MWNSAILFNFNTKQMRKDIFQPSQFGLSILGKRLWSWCREELRCELRCFGHVSCNFHLSLHEGHLRVESSHAYLFEVIVSHGESRVDFLGRSFLAVAFPVFHVDLVDQFWLGTLLWNDLEAEG